MQAWRDCVFTPITPTFLPANGDTLIVLHIDLDDTSEVVILGDSVALASDTTNKFFELTAVRFMDLPPVPAIGLWGYAILLSGLVTITIWFILKSHRASN